MNECFVCLPGFKIQDGRCVPCPVGYLQCQYPVNYYLHCDFRLGYIFDFEFLDCVYSEKLAGKCTRTRNGTCFICDDHLVPNTEVVDNFECIDARPNCINYRTTVTGIYQGSCHTCEDGYYRTGLTNKFYCQRCPAACSTCLQKSSCLFCDDPHYFFRDGNCFPCDSRCLTCYAEGEQCLLCPDGSNAFKGKCGEKKLELFELYKASQGSKFKIRFHHFVIWFVILLGLFSMTLRLIFIIDSWQYDHEYFHRK